MDVVNALRPLEAERCLAERELAVGDWERARRRAGRALETLDTGLRKAEPELWNWVRILGALAHAEANGHATNQLPLWPELRGPAEGAGDAWPAAPQRPIDPGAVGLITRDERMRAALAFLDALAPTDLPVLLEGETGCGKEVVARAIHTLSGRPSAGFVAVNCGAIPSELQESELFGHSRGAFTGAQADKPGLFEAAHDGTLFLDEIGEMDGRSQVKLLRVLETGEIRRLGEVRTRRVAVRVVAATNAEVDEAVAQGRFRRDLLFRLGAVRVRLPPLRERPGDILPLATHFLRKAVVRLPALTPAAQRALLRHDWPGNVRELKFVIERAAALWRRTGRPDLGEELLLLGGTEGESRLGLGWAVSRAAAPPAVAGAEPAGADPARSGVPPADLPGEVPDGESLDSFLETIERRLIVRALQRGGGNRTLAAQLLGGMSRTTLIGKMRRFGVA